MNDLAIYNTKNDSHFISIFDSKKIDLLKSTICKGSTNDEFELFLHACQRTGLDPFMKQIYAVKRWDSNLRRESMTIQTSIDGYRLIAERTGKYSPGREPTFKYNENGTIISATSYVKKQTEDGTWHEVAATAFFNEYCQRTKDGKTTKFWNQMGHTMIAKCAEALALRKAFPGDLSGIYTKEEMLQSTCEAFIDNDLEIKNQEKEKISENELIELNDLLDNCLESFREKINIRLDALSFNKKSDIDKELFIKLKKACEDHIKKNKSVEKNENH